ncbi:transposase [Roseococcus sp. YIM B11640]|uniref:transposase n=1 Tax=Roseococcus sp. YIM B11640 TaxID=3133973 RepID=UPI003C79F48D
MTHAPALTDTEYALLLRHIPHRGRPPADRRRTLDAIFHIAVTRRPWRELPGHLGRPDTAHRQLRRWMRAGVLDALLKAAARPEFAPLRLRICRAWRRASGLATVAQLVMARSLRLPEALPAAPWFLPDPALSETVRNCISRLLKNPWAASWREFGRLGRLLAFAGGNPRRWRRR